MKNSRTSLNKPFYDWVKQVREADKKIVELEDKLYYYNVKLIGYKSPNFEPRLSSTKPEYKDNRYIWIDKITETKKEISKLIELKKSYKIFKKGLCSMRKIILDDYYHHQKCKTEISKSYRYKVLNDIAIIYNDLISDKIITLR